MLSSLRTLDFTPSAIDSIWAMTAAILHLGNVDFFLDENDTAGIRNMDVVDKVLREKFFYDIGFGKHLQNIISRYPVCWECQPTSFRRRS